MAIYSSAGVYVVQTDLSQVIATTATSIGAVVVYANKGPINTPVLTTSTQNYLATFGNPNPSNGYGAYAALAFLNQSSQLFVSRVVNGNYAYAGAVIDNSGAQLTGQGSGQKVPTNTGLDVNQPFYIYAIGPGVYANTLKVGITSNNMYNPDINSAETTGSGSFTVPAIGATVNVTVADASTLISGANVYVMGMVGSNTFVSGAGYYTVGTISGNVVTLTNNKNANGVTTGTVINYSTLNPALISTTILNYTTTGGVTGLIASFGTIVPGSGYASGGTNTFYNVPLNWFSGQIGYGATATITVTGGIVTGVVITNPGTGYGITGGNISVVTASASSLGGTGSGFSVPVSRIVSALGGNVSASTFVGGTGYTNGTYTDVALTVASGTVGVNARATITVAGGIVTGVVFTNQGSGYDNTSVLTAPTTVIGAGSSFAISVTQTGLYYYQVSAFNSLGETTASIYKSIQIPVPALGQAPTITVGVSSVTSALGYKIYGRTASDSFSFINTLAANASASAVFVDDGSIAPNTSMPSGGIVPFTPTNVFTVNIYDTAISNNIQTSYTVSLANTQNGMGQQQQIDVNINNASTSVRVYLNPLYSGSQTLYSMSPVSFSGGLDGDPYSLIPDGVYINALQQYADKETVTIRLLIEGGRGSPAYQIAMDQLCQTRQDCVAIMDIPSAYQLASSAVQYRNLQLNLNSNRSTIYTPDLYVSDPYNDLVLYVPPSGYVAGVYAYTDFVANAWYAPAGLNRGLLSVLGLRYKYNLGDRNLLAPAQVNYIRNFPGIGMAVWEAYTLQTNLSAFSFVNVRRLFDLIGVAVGQALLFSDWEPDDEFLQRSIVNLIANYLNPIVQARGIISYNIVCNSSNNPPQLTAMGQLNVDVYIEPTLPVRVIQLQLIATQQGSVTVQEVQTQQQA